MSWTARGKRSFNGLFLPRHGLLWQDEQTLSRGGSLTALAVNPGEAWAGEQMVGRAVTLTIYDVDARSKY